MLLGALCMGMVSIGPSLGLSAAPAQQNTPAAVDAPAAPLDTPTILVDEALDEFALHAGQLYWANRCFVVPLQAADAAQELSYLRRKPTAGGATGTLLTDPSCFQFKSLAVDSQDAIYFNGGRNRIERIPLTVASSAPISVTNGFGVNNLVIDSEFVYFTDSGNKIYRAPRGGGPPIILFDADFFIGDLIVDATWIYWFDRSGFWWAEKTCAAPPCAKQNLAGTTGRHMVLGDFNLAGDPRTVYAVTGGNTQSIVALRCRSDGLCPFDNLYTAATGWQINEFRVVTLPSNRPTPIAPKTLFWSETHAPSNTSRLLRKPLGSTANPDELYPGTAAMLPHLAADSRGVYFADNNKLMFLPFSASAIVRDLAADNLEVTQAIQNLANGTPLVADKTTYVRLYGKSLSGPRAAGVEAQLIGTRNGQSLPGSPLWPVKGAPSLTQGVPYDRALLGDSWLFKLPAGWTTGNVVLQGVIDPRGRYADTNTANNRLTVNASFGDEPNACLFFSPVRTHNPLPKVGDPNFWETVDRFTRLWPIAKTDVRWVGEPVEELEFCSKWGIPYPCWGPYELDQGVSLTNFPSDKDRVIIKLILRQAENRIVALVPGICDSIFSSVHTVGMVHPQADTTDDNGFTTSGYANLFFNASWVKFPPHDSRPGFPVWNWPDEAQTLAQEVTHNFWRQHVNCGNPEGIDNDWPYANPCQLNDGGPSNYYGFDPATLSIIPPENASDFMSYQPSRSVAPTWQGHWVSDYTYKAVKGKFAAAQISAAATTHRDAPSLAAAENFVYISGAAHHHTLQGYLEYAYVQPTSAVGAAALGVWQSYAAPDAPLAGTQPITFHVRLKDSAGAILADHAIALLQPDAHDESSAAPFLATFPAPTGSVATIELLFSQMVIDSLTVGPGQPTVQIFSPTAGATISDTLTIRWRGVDPDAGDVLRYNLHYSPDNGTTWLPLAHDHPGVPGEEAETLTLAYPQALPGSDGPQALVRVTASDGYHTTAAVAGPFTVNNRAPQPAILSPEAGDSLAAGDPALLRGAAYDAEDGTLSSAALRWAVAGTEVGSGDDVIVAGLRPGAHPVVLTATDSDGQQGTAQTTLQVDPLFVPAGSAPLLDGSCEDGSYAGGKLLFLAPYSDGAQASVVLLRQGDALWLCFSGLARGSDEQIGQVVLYADGDRSGGNVVQANDLAFIVGEDGGVMTLAGDGSGGFGGPGPGGLAARVSATADLWQAEMQIALNSPAGVGPTLGLALTHARVTSADDRYAWPYAAQSSQPATWAHTLLGEWPYLTALTPLTTTVGTPTTLTLSGERFGPTATVRINGVVVPTTVVSPTQLTANLTGAAVASAGMAEVTVVNPGLTAPSNALRLAIQNHTPTITAITPQSAAEEGASFTLTVQGSNFAPGAIIRWDGGALVTTPGSAGQLTALVPREELTIGRTVLVQVENPGPGGGLSNGAAFTIAPAYRLLLPAIKR
jgi:hypothetical protein